MGNSMMAYSAIATKIRGMDAKLLKEEDYQTIAAMKTVTEVISWLNDHSVYGKFLEQFDEGFYHRGNIEKILVTSLYDDYIRLYRFSNQKQKDFLKLFMKRYEVELINHCLRIVFNHYHMTFDLDYKKPFFDKFSKIRIERLVTSENIEDLIGNLKETEYYEPLKRVLDSGAKELIDYDLALNLYYFSAMWKRGKKLLDKKEQEVYLKNLGNQIDLMNLSWIYRSKKYYHLPEKDIYPMLIPIQYRLSVGQMKELCEAPGLEEFFRVLNEKTPYGRKYHFDEENSIEKMVDAWLAHLYVMAYRKHPYSIASIHNYLFRKEKEINTITTAMECIRYGLKETEILNYIQRPLWRDYQGGNEK